MKTERKHINPLTQDPAPKKSSINSLCHFIMIMVMFVVNLIYKLN